MVSLSVPGAEETMSEVDYPSARSRFGLPGRSSSRAMLPLRRLDTLTEVPSVTVVDESRVRRGRGMSRINSSSSDSRVPAPRRQVDSSTDHGSGSSGDHRNRHHEAEEGEEEQQQPTLPHPAWAPEPSERDNRGTRNPLLKGPQWNPKKS